MFTAVRGGKAFAAEQEIRELRKEFQNLMPKNYKFHQQR